MMLKMEHFKALRIKMEYLCVFLLILTAIVSANSSSSKVNQRKTVIYSSGYNRFTNIYIHESSVNRLNHHRTVFNLSGIHQKTLFNSADSEENQNIQESSVNRLNHYKTVFNLPGIHQKTLFKSADSGENQNIQESSVNALDKWKTVFINLESGGTQRKPLFDTLGSMGTQKNQVEHVRTNQNAGTDHRPEENLGIHKKTVQNLGTNQKTSENVRPLRSYISLENLDRQNTIDNARTDQRPKENLGIHQKTVKSFKPSQKTVKSLGTHQKTSENVQSPLLLAPEENLEIHQKTVQNLKPSQKTVKNLGTHQKTSENVQSPLFLTPYIEKGHIREAQQLSKVKPFVKGVTSYAGLLTVNKIYDSNLFFWFFPSKTNWTNSPIAVWLQGGPGGSSLYGLFKENGPYIVERNQKLKLRKFSWHRKCNMIYIDSPVGTGYSFTRSQDGYARNQTRIGEDLYQAIKQFLTMFPQIQSNPFYITGESYAGKFIPALGYSIHTHNAHSLFKINLQGLLIGNGLTDPENMIPVYADVLYGLGFIDYNQKKVFEQRQESTVQAIRNNDWETATLLYSQLIIGYSFFPYPTFYTNSTGLTTYYNYVNENSATKWYDYENDFVTSAKFRRHLHVGNITRDPGYLTEKFMENDIAKSVINWVKELVEHYRVTFFNGQLDIICAYPLTENFLRKMEWSGARNFRETRRKLWKVDGELAGYVRSSGNLGDILVRNAGHMVPTEQPKWAYHLFNNFIYNRTF